MSRSSFLIPSAGLSSLLAGLLLATGCGSSSKTETPGDDASVDHHVSNDAASKGDSGGRSDASAPFECGKSSCNAGQWCVQECTCGGEVACNPPPDSGTCPAGFTMELCGGGVMGCIKPCENPPPTCVDSIPPSCGVGTSSSSPDVNCPCPG